VVPYYNRPSQAGLHAYFRAIAESTDLPIILMMFRRGSGAVWPMKPLRGSPNCHA
jgi:dihydrodipicolinate synthase/N-acetylneuraminate lyase